MKAHERNGGAMPDRRSLILLALAALASSGARAQTIRPVNTLDSPDGVAIRGYGRFCFQERQTRLNPVRHGIKLKATLALVDAPGDAHSGTSVRRRSCRDTAVQESGLPGSVR